MLAPAPGGGCLSQGHGPGTTAGPGPARGRAGGQAAMAAVRAPPGRSPRGRRRAPAVRSGPGWARLPVPASLTATPAASLPPHHMAGSPQRRPRFLPGTRHALRREEGRGGACGDTWVTGPGGGPLEGPQSGLVEGVCTRHTRGARGREEDGTHRLAATSQAAGLGFDFLLPVEALRVLELRHALPDGHLGAATIQVVQVGPGLL